MALGCIRELVQYFWTSSLRNPLADRTIPLKSSYRGIVFRKMRKDSRWVNPGAHAGAGQPASSWLTAPSHYPQFPCWAPCWAIIVKMRYSSCQQRLSTDFRNAGINYGVIKWKHLLRYWLFVWRIHRWPVNSPRKVQWHGALLFSLICAWINQVFLW